MWHQSLVLRQFVPAFEAQPAQSVEKFDRAGMAVSIAGPTESKQPADQGGVRSGWDVERAVGIQQQCDGLCGQSRVGDRWMARR